MNKVILTLAITVTSFGSSFAWADKHSNLHTIDATTQHPIYQLEGKPVLGRLENVYFEQLDQLAGVAFAGKIDTGADTTSMHASNIHTSSRHPDFKHLKDDELLWAIVDDLGGTKAKWKPNTFKPYQVTVSFTKLHPYTGKEVTIEDDLERISAIRSRSSDTAILRPTIQLPLTIADRTVMTDINLTDRSDFSAPLLIGKTFLKDNAWVLAGYDYLQEQPKARLIGRKESVNLAGLNQTISYSFSNNYSSLHATNIQFDDNQQVTFDIETKSGQRQTLTQPLVRMLNVGGEERPLVFVPVTLNDQEQQDWLVYLTDRSQYSSQLRLGKETLNKHFVVDTRQKALLSSKAQPFNHDTKAAIVSGKESLILDGVALNAEPSLTVQTPLLKVTSFEVTEIKGKSWVTYYLDDADGNSKKFSKPINKTLKVGDSSRPVVFGSFSIKDIEVELPFALEVLEDEKTPPYFVIGKKMSKHGVMINTRSDYLFNPYDLFKAGHIETVQMEGLSFPAKLDTGADVSSLNAQNIEYYQENGKPMVRFTYQNEKGVEQTFTREVVDEMRIKAKQGEKANSRPVVEMHVQLGELEKRIRVNLQDRSRFKYSMILGKNFLRYGAVVSSDDNYLATKKLK